MKKYIQFRYFLWFAAATFMVAVPGSLYSVDSTRSAFQWAKTKVARAKEETIDRLIKEYRAMQELRRKKAAGIATPAERAALQRRMKRIKIAAAAIGLSLAAIAAGVYGYREYRKEESEERKKEEQLKKRTEQLKKRTEQLKKRTERWKKRYEANPWNAMERMKDAVGRGDKEQLSTEIQDLKKRIELENDPSTKKDHRSSFKKMRRRLLVAAIDKDDTDMADFLLRNNAPVNESVLKAAVRRKGVPMMQLLLKASGDKKFGESLLKEALWNEDVAMATVLIDHYGTGVPFYAARVFYSKKPELIRLFLDKKLWPVDQAIPHDLTPLERAVYGGSVPVVRMLLEEYDALFQPHAMAYAIINGSDAIVALLLEHASQQDKDDALVYVVKARMDDKRKKPMIDTMLKYGADINSSSYEGLNPLVAALINGDNEIAKYLLTKGADVGVVVSGRTGHLDLMTAIRHVTDDALIKMIQDALARSSMREANKAELIRALPPELRARIAAKVGVPIPFAFEE